MYTICKDLIMYSKINQKWYDKVKGNIALNKNTVCDTCLTILSTELIKKKYTVSQQHTCTLLWRTWGHCHWHQWLVSWQLPQQRGRGDHCPWLTPPVGWLGGVGCSARMSWCRWCLCVHWCRSHHQRRCPGCSWLGHWLQHLHQLHLPAGRKLRLNCKWNFYYISQNSSSLYVSLKTIDRAHSTCYMGHEGEGE